jgi:hypothetical protein
MVQLYMILKYQNKHQAENIFYIFIFLYFIKLSKVNFLFYIQSIVQSR